jgi:hypothetical protein
VSGNDSGRNFHDAGAAGVASIFDPLADFYRRMQVPVPRITEITARQMPEGERRLLVHNRDMTPTLEAAHGRPLHLQVLAFAVEENVVRRLVALMLDEVEIPVEMGAIRIFLDRLPEQARRAVLQQREPLGGVLRRTGVPHYSRPAAYFRVVTDGLIRDALRLTRRRAVYGRRNTIWNAADSPLAEVVEILPPSKSVGYLGDRL